MKSRKLKRHSKHLKKTRNKLGTRKLGTRKLGTRKLGTRKLGNTRLHRLKTQHGGSVIPVRILEDINREAPSLDDTIKRLILKWNNNPNRSTSINKKDNGIIDIYLSLGNIHNKNRHIHVFNTIKIKQDGKKYIDWSLKLGWGQHRFKNKLMPLIPVDIKHETEINEIMDDLIYNWVFNIYLESSGIKLRDYISDIPANYRTPRKFRTSTNQKPISSHENPEDQEETTLMLKDVPVARSLFDDLNEAEMDKQPIMQQPVMQQPVMQQPAMQQPIMPQPAMQQPIMPQPAMQQPAIQQPVSQSKQSRKRNQFRKFI